MIEQAERIFSESEDLRARILIVEDDYLASIDLEAALLETGFEVVGIAATASEAVSCALNKKPTLVIMDVRLKGKRTGVDAAIEIFERLGVRSIFATAYDDPELVAQAKPAAPLAWIHKPYRTHELIEVVRRAFEQLRAQDLPASIANVT